MRKALNSQMIAVFDNHNSRSIELLEQYRINSEADELEAFLLNVHNSFLRGAHKAFLQFILEALIRKLGSQQRVAEALGLKDRTSISQMKRSGTIDGVRLTAALYTLADELSLPSREMAAVFGFAYATSYIKAIAYGDDSIEGSMDPQDFSYLVSVLANGEWEGALRDPDPRLARAIAKKVIEERALTARARVMIDRCRPEQLVLMLQRILVEWGDFSVLALCSIPECIPEREVIKQESAALDNREISVEDISLVKPVMRHQGLQSQFADSRITMATTEPPVRERLAGYLRQLVTSWQLYFSQPAMRGTGNTSETVWEWQSEDGVLRASLKLEKNADLTLLLSAREPKFEGVRFKLRLGLANLDVTLRRVSEKEVGGKFEIPWRMRARNLTDLSIELA